MPDGLWTDEELQRMEAETLKEHKRMFDLYEIDPFKFEAEKKEKIEEFINSVPEEHKESLRILQKEWDESMNESGSPQDRMMMAKKVLFKHIMSKFQPAVEDLKDYLMSEEFTRTLTKRIINEMKKK